MRFVVTKKKCGIVECFVAFFQLEKEVESGKRQMKMKDDDMDNLEERFREKSKLLEEAEERLEEALR